MKKLQLIAFWIAMLSFYGCSLNCDEEIGSYGNEEQKQYFSPSYEQTPNNWQPIIGVFGIYPVDSIQLYDENYEPVESFGKSVTGDCNFVYVDVNTPKEKDLVKTYYLYLSYQDTDTIRHEYRVNEKTCKYLLDYGRFFYNNKLITSSTNNKPIPYATFSKN